LSLAILLKRRETKYAIVDTGPNYTK